jgi:hypothetical protein
MSPLRGFKNRLCISMPKLFQPFGLVGAKKIAVAGLQNPEGMA